MPYFIETGPHSPPALKKHVWTIPAAERSPRPTSVSPPCTKYNVNLSGVSQFSRVKGFAIHKDDEAKRWAHEHRRASPVPSLLDDLDGGVAAKKDYFAKGRPRRNDSPKETPGAAAKPRRNKTSRTLAQPGPTISRTKLISESDLRQLTKTPAPGQYATTQPFGSRVHGGQWSKRDRFEVDREAAASPGPGFYRVAEAPLSSTPGVTISRSNPRPALRGTVTPGPGSYDMPPIPSRGVSTLDAGISMPAAVFLASRIAHDPTIRDPAFLGDLHHISTTAQFIGRHQLLSRLA